jgi:hypothetical protein
MKKKLVIFLLFSFLLCIGNPSTDDKQPTEKKLFINQLQLNVRHILVDYLTISDMLAFALTSRTTIKQFLFLLQKIEQRKEVIKQLFYKPNGNAYSNDFFKIKDNFCIDLKQLKNTQTFQIFTYDNGWNRQRFIADRVNHCRDVDNTNTYSLLENVTETLCYATYRYDIKISNEFKIFFFPCENRIIAKINSKIFEFDTNFSKIQFYIKETFKNNKGNLDSKIFFPKLQFLISKNEVYEKVESFNIWNVLLFFIVLMFFYLLGL